jgi:hypothetical protein
MTMLLTYLGRLHVVVLHLPIGFLVLAFLMELANRRSLTSVNFQPAIRFSLFWGMTSAALAAGLGYLLSLDGDYDAELLRWHQWSGFGTAGLAALLYYAAKSEVLTKVYFPLFLLTMSTLAVAGHFGGSLTHGSDYLFKKATGKTEATSPVNIDTAEVFAGVIQPIFKSKCGSCHNPEKRKGELSLLTKEDLLKGGELGPVINLGKLSESPLLSINFPLDNEYHMPPKGKKQLTLTEKKILEWWVYAGGPMDKTVAECGMPDSLKTMLKAQASPKTSPLEALKLDPVSKSELDQLRREGIPVFPMATGSPFLQVLLPDRKDLSATSLGKLKKVAPNVVSFNAGNSNLDDGMMAALAGFPHLNRLYLNQTAVSDDGLKHLSKLTYLEYLNLYKTQVTDAGLAQLKDLKNLKNLYLWQTSVTENGLAKFASYLPQTVVNKGSVSDSIFGEVSLRPPVVTASKDLFTDTVHVALSAGFGKAAIRYTLDGSAPDSASPLYEKPLVLNASAELSAIATKEGWKSSEAVSRSFIKVRYQPKDIVLTKKPNPKYAGEGGKTLGDLAKGSLTISDGKWLGYQGSHLVATLDLGAESEISKVAVGSLENTGSWIFFPKGLRISTSTDGKTFKKVKETSYPVATEPTTPALKTFRETFAPAKARYVKVEVLSALSNPKWHPSPGSPCWVFADEITVE